ncbi:hypothetical protein [Secundilactobacillus collinoides]|uniref:Malate lactate dehydrogenase n=2 Tax=Secundilactobacillus collinoides TaxID=33960 RepID=A0A0R2B3X4_SECCO|nr:hypothetical protein [Secundilactobacillus collinoides]KRM74088.1 malate lactate dehydrogenase [Secundilactobacillus collinoides DSM 20515 = JCM 1123]KZL39032.1 hypothetical protein TY91_10835 [Secundilactobacillus collinoides]
MKAKVVICGDTSRIDSFLTTMIMKDPSVAGIVLPVESETENSDTALSALVTAAHLCQQFSLTVGKNEDLASADVVVIALERPQIAAEDMLTYVQGIMPKFRKLVNSVIENGFKGKILISAPFDELLVYFAWRFSGLPQTQLLGVGTFSQTLFLQSQLKDRLRVGENDVSALVVGTPQQQLIVWSRSYVGPAPVLMYLANQDNHFSAEDIANLEAASSSQSLMDNWAIQDLALDRLLMALVEDRPLIATVSNIQTEHEVGALAISTPVLVSLAGVRRLTDLTLSDSEETDFETIISQLRQTITEIENGKLGGTE